MDDFTNAGNGPTDNEKARKLMVLLHNHIHGRNVPVPSTAEASLRVRAEGYDFGILLTVNDKDKFCVLKDVLTHSGATINGDRGNLGANREEILFNKTEIDPITKAVSIYTKLREDVRLSAIMLALG